MKERREKHYRGFFGRLLVHKRFELERGRKKEGLP